MAGDRVLQAPVRCASESAQNAVLIGFSHITDGGHFTRHFTPKAGKVGTGTWKVVARLRCESGEDGSPNFITQADAEDQAVTEGSNSNCGWVGRCRERAGIS